MAEAEAHCAGIVAILLGAALVYLRFPKRAREEELLSEYRAHDEARAESAKDAVAQTERFTPHGRCATTRPSSDIRQQAPKIATIQPGIAHNRNERGWNEHAHSCRSSQTHHRPNPRRRRGAAR
jgi:hypothetical protein